MRITTRAILISFLGIGLLAGERVSAEQAKLIQWDDPVATTIVDEKESGISYEAVLEDGEIFGGTSTTPGCEICGGGNSTPPDWYWENDVRILTRSRPRESILTWSNEWTLSDAILLGQNVSVFRLRPQGRMSTQSFGFDTAAGYATTLGRYLGRDTANRDQFLEFSYWGLNNWLETKSVTGDRRTEVQLSPLPVAVTYGTLNSAFTQMRAEKFLQADGFFDTQDESLFLKVGGFNRADSHSVIYESDINSYEMNIRLRPRVQSGGRDRLVLYPNGKWRRECPPGHYVSYLFGLRVISVNESFEFHSRGSIDLGGQPAGDVSGDYSTRSQNDLIGLQVGGDYVYRKCKWTYGVRAKGGPYLNFSEMAIRAVSNSVGIDPFALVDVDYFRANQKRGAALVADFGFVGSYQIRPNCTLRAAYDFMWISGMALAPEQAIYDVVPPANSAVNDNGVGYYHGLSLGLTIVR